MLGQSDRNLKTKEKPNHTENIINIADCDQAVCGISEYRSREVWSDIQNLRNKILTDEQSTSANAHAEKPGPESPGNLKREKKPKCAYKAVNASSSRAERSKKARSAVGKHASTEQEIANKVKIEIALGTHPHIWCFACCYYPIIRVPLSDVLLLVLCIPCDRVYYRLVS